MNERIKYSKIYNLIITIRRFIMYLIVSTLYMFKKKNKYKILTNEETIDLIINKKMSIARYGDGEFKWIIGLKQVSFQDDSEELSKKLDYVLQNKENNKNVLIGIPSLMNNMKEYTYESKRYWKKFLLLNYTNISKHIDDTMVFCDSYITRPYLDLKNKNQRDVQKRFDNLKKIWDGKDIIIVEGELSRLGVGNDLFKNAKKINRIICPPKNAFDKYYDIYNSIIKQGKDYVYIISLGPTATILAYELSQKGYQCIDLGHIDIEYMWFKNRAKRKEKVPGKYVNEIKDNGIIEEVKDNEYHSQIIERISL